MTPAVEAAAATGALAHAAAAAAVAAAVFDPALDPDHAAPTAVAAAAPLWGLSVA